MPSRASVRERATGDVVERLKLEHGCGPDCLGCARDRARAGIPALLSDWMDFVRSRDALRLALLCQRSGRPLPQLTNDDVVQFCVEEALFERLSIIERLSANRAARELDGTGLGDERAGDPRLEEALAKAREFARTGKAAA